MVLQAPKEMSLILPKRQLKTSEFDGKSGRLRLIYIFYVRHIKNFDVRNIGLMYVF